MPTNLPPDYFEVEKRFRAAESVVEKIACLEEMLSTIPKHKGTDKLRADLRRKLSKLKSSAQTRKSVGKRDSVYNIDREGAGRVVVVGHANVGKSALVAGVTNATPKVAASPFSTWRPTPGMMPIDNIQVQLIDTPPLNRDFVEPELMDLIRGSDLILLVVDLQTEPIVQLEESVALLEEHRIIPAHHIDRHTDDRRLSFIPVIVLVNKNDDESTDEDFNVFKELLGGDWLITAISVTTNRNLDRLKREVFQSLEIIRVFSKAPGRDPDLSAPFVLEAGSTVEEFARKVHLDFYENLKAARVWGSGVFDGQLVGRDHILHDGDIVELRI
jgi:ribosome-interacting GTPase 1